MSLQPLKTIVRTVHGSHLYGTANENSDKDFKGIHLPSGESILLGTIPHHIDRSESRPGAKNCSDDIDETSYALAKWLTMLAEGDSFATEILFAPEECIIEQSLEWASLREQAKGLLTRQCSGFVGYCQRQATNYGIKGARMEVCEAAIAMLENAMARLAASSRLRDLGQELYDFVEAHPYCAILDIQTPQNTPLDHLEILERKIPVTIRMTDALTILQKIHQAYGSRAQAAKDNRHVDWKSLAHAIRVARQALELLNTGKITFPRPEAPLLRDIRAGAYDYPVIAQMLKDLVGQIDVACAASSLPAQANHDLVNRMILDAHLRQICGE